MTLRRQTVAADSAASRWHGVLRWCGIALAAALLCGCRGLEPPGPLQTGPTPPMPPTVAPNPPVAAPRPLPAPPTAAAPTAWQSPVPMGVPAAMPVAPWAGECYQPVPPCYPPAPPCCGPQPDCPPGVTCGGWTPPGLTCPWPEDEYLCDGDDQLPHVQVRQDWSVAGLQLEDTVAHFDTLDGQTEVVPSNRVCVYAPRFAAVRKVYGLVQHDQHEQLSGVDNPIPLGGLGEAQVTTTTVQPLRPRLSLGTLTPRGFRERTPPTGLENSQALTGMHGELLPYEDFALVRRGQMENSEKARLAEYMTAAIAWSHDTAVQVLIDDVAAHEDVALSRAAELKIFVREGKSRLQVCKLASRKEALPGETVEFTIRFDNVGDQVIGNVTVIDNLTTRLEYVEGSQSSTLPATFAVSANAGDSLTLRWEITEPMKVGTGGVIRFQCRVR
ncbi:MAG: DUF11 domain-containing protein [Pirellulaceae bacterium]|nr:DUF11 domain-containing protein [Pirellulaceae bacterium]